MGTPNDCPPWADPERPCACLACQRDGQHAPWCAVHEEPPARCDCPQLRGTEATRPIPIYRATVTSGRVRIAGSTNLPDGETVELVPVAEVLAQGAGLAAEQREHLTRALEQALGGLDGDEFVGQYLATVRGRSVMPIYEAKAAGGSFQIDATSGDEELECGLLVSLADVLAHGGDYLDALERTELHESLKEGFAEAERGETVDAHEFLRELRDRHK